MAVEDPNLFGPDEMAIGETEVREQGVTEGMLYFGGGVGQVRGSSDGVKAEMDEGGLEGRVEGSWDGDDDAGEGGAGLEGQSTSVRQ